MANAGHADTSNWGEHVVGILNAYSSKFWWLTVVFFFVGDILTTGIGLHVGGVAEVGPLVGPILDRHGLLAMFPLKLAAVGTCYLLWRVAPEPYAVGVPLGLGTFGVLVTSWNTGVLIVSLVLL